MTATISAGLVMQMRERTGAGMMDCKKYLVQNDGDIEKAIIEMRKDGGAKADKKAGRIAAEGVITIARADDSSAVMLEINSETDFVARDTNFIEFSEAVAQAALSIAADDVDMLSAQKLVDGSTIEEARQHLVAKIGENVKLRRMAHLQCDGGVVGCYLHGSRIGVMVALKNGDEALAKGIAMHIAASKPIVVSRDQVSAESIENEREIFTAQAKESGKPQEIIDKMIEGRINKFTDEVSLLGQPYVKNPDIKVGQLLKEHNAEVVSFIRFEVGEGIEKKEDNFVEEVMAQVRS